MAPSTDPYRALGVARGATLAEIKKAHRKLAKRFHPDAPKGDAKRFLVVQEAYRVLSDPLLRREWDARHAPGPVRATAKAPTKRPATTATRPARKAKAPEAPTTSGGPAGARPRSTRSYTWSASEVPWWEEGVNHKAARPRRRANGASAAAAESEPGEERPVAPDFEVYNRSSGAAWSMAARAYFRKGDADLPSRGVFRTVGAQPLTGGKARAAAEAEKRHRDKP